MERCAQSSSISLPGGRCTGTGTKPTGRPGQALGRWPYGGARWRGEWQQEVCHQPGRERTQPRGTQETLCRANATHPSAAGGQGWELATWELATRLANKIRGKISEMCCHANLT